MEPARGRPAWAMAGLDSRFSTLILACLVATLCYGVSRVAPSLIVPPEHFALFWPGTALLVAVLVLTPRRIWPVLIAAGLGAMALCDFENGCPIGTIIYFTLGDLTGVLVATVGLGRLFGGVPELTSAKALGKYSVVAVILAPFVSAFWGAVPSLPGGYWLQWRLWFFSESLPFLTVTPAILSWYREGRVWARRRNSYAEFTALTSLLVLFGYLVFLTKAGTETPALLYSLVALLLWAALRLGLKGVSTSMVVVAVLSIWGAANGRSPFSGQGVLSTVSSLQLFLFFAAAPFMVLSAIVEEKRLSRRALIDKEVQLEEAQRLAQIGSWLWDVKSDTVSWSGELYRIFRRDPSLPVPSYKEHALLYTPESWGRLSAAVETSLRTGTPYHLDLEIVCANGESRLIAARGEAVRDASGLTVQLRGTAQDITELKQAEEALKQSEERFRMAAQAGRMYAFEWDVATDRIVRSGNSGQIFGNDEMVDAGKEVMTKVHPEDRERLSAAVALLRPEEPYFQVSHRMMRSDDTVIWVDRSCRAHFDAQGRMLRIVGMVADITERKRADEALVSARHRLINIQEQERVRIARELHDDIGQRLALLAVGIEQVKNDVPEKADEIRARAHELWDQTVEISHDIQVLSHELHSSRLESLGLVLAMRGFCREFSEHQKLKIVFDSRDIPSAVPPDISLCLFRVVQEALRNAAKHSGATQIEVQLWGSSDAVHLSVRDSGAGFDPEAAKRGQGLGLISMQERVELIKGTLFVDSQPKCGTTIKARVPFSSRGISVSAPH
jgi:PAS domain S-box-containing protein